MVLSVCPNPSIDTYSMVSQMTPGGINRIIEQKEFAGGKGLHVAFALRELGEECSVYGFWGGSTGSWLRQRCAEHGIVCWGPTVKESNRKCYTLFSTDKSSDWNNTELLEPGPIVTKKEYECFINEFVNKAELCNIICFSGSWPKGGFENGYYDLITYAKKRVKKFC